MAATSGWSPPRTSPRSCPFRDHPHRAADNGGHGGGKKKHGDRGERPRGAGPGRAPGPGRADGTILCDLVNAGDRWLAGEGGRGGRGNASFLSNNRRAPTFAEQGEKGHEEWYDLELALVADVALVGYPNVGKSTLISRISAAKPKIADYPFTTLEPHLGVVRTDDEANFTVADIPGLVEGAAEGKGLGHQFLRHITRARVLVVLVELDPVTGVPRRSSTGCSSTSCGGTSRSCWTVPGWWWGRRPTWWHRRTCRDRRPPRRSTAPDRPPSVPAARRVAGPTGSIPTW